MTKNNLVVRESNLIHNNHRSDQATFQNYPENLRLNKKQMNEAQNMVRLGVNKTILKASFLKKGKAVPLKTLHNIQTKQQNAYQRPNGASELHQLLEEFEKIANARIRVFVNDAGELIGKF